MTGFGSASSQLNMGIPDSVLDKPLLAYQKDNMWHFLNHRGVEMFPPMPLVYLFGYSEGLFAARAINPQTQKPTCIYFDSDAQVRIITDADIIDPFTNGMAITAKVQDNEELPYRAGFINTEGKQVVPMDYVDFTNYNSGLAYIMDTLAKEGWRGYVDKNGDPKIELPNNIVGYKFSDGIAAVGDSKPNIGFIDTTGTYVLPMIYDSPGIYSEGLIATSDDSFLGYVSIEEQGFVIGPAFDIANPFKEGRAWVGSLDSKGKLRYALINKKGDYIKDFLFEDAMDFSEGFGVASLNGKYVFVDKDGEFPIDKYFSSAMPFINGLAWVADKEEMTAGFINKKGDMVVSVPMADKYMDLRLNREVSFMPVIPEMQQESVEPDVEE
jgi:hypothetical protein